MCKVATVSWSLDYLVIVLMTTPVTEGKEKEADTEREVIETHMQQVVIGINKAH